MNTHSTRWFLIPLLLIAFLLFGFILGQQSRQTETPPVEQPATQPAAPIVEKPIPTSQPVIRVYPSLDSPRVTPDTWNMLIDCHLENMAFTDVIMEYFIEVYGLHIFVNWPDLPDIKKTPVNLNLKNVTLGKVLDLMLQTVSRDGIDIGYGEEDGVLVIDLIENLRQYQTTHVYDCAALFCDIRKSPYRSFDAPSPITIKQKEITLAIQNSIDKGHWNSSKTGPLLRWLGNPPGTSMVITQIQQNHCKILNLLEHFRENNHPQKKPPAPEKYSR